MKKIVKILSVLMAAVMALSALGITAFAESIEDTAKSIKSGENVSAIVGDDSKDYKIKVSKKGTLKIDISLVLAKAFIYVYDSNGNKVEMYDYTSEAGSVSRTKADFSELYWNNVTEKYSGTLKYEVQKGTYYIRVEKGWWATGKEVKGSGKLNFTATFPSSSSASSSAKISYLSIEIPKGTKMQLGAVVSAKTNSSIKWSTSKSSVVSVTSKGKITAKKKGTAIITAKLGSSTMKIKIKVK